MGTKVEFNSVLALWNYSEYDQGNRTLEECLPDELKVNGQHDFLQSGQQIYALEQHTPILEAPYHLRASKILAYVIIHEITQFTNDGRIWTKGAYTINELVYIRDKSFISILKDNQ